VASHPTPHTCSSTRVTRGEKYTTPTAVLSEEPCLFSPFEPAFTFGTFMGPAETGKTILFIGYDADVQMGDEITNDATSEKYVAVEPPVKFQRPTDFSNDHQQVILRKQPIS